MAAENVKFRDFCRRWRITNQGEDNWPTLVDLNARFIIVRSAHRYRFIPLNGCKGALREKELEKYEDESYGQGHTGKKLKGALKATFDELPVVFTLNEISADRFEISLSLGSAPLTQAAEVLVHGGPHGVDD